METVPENSIPGLSDSIAKIREDVKSGVENLTEECVSTMADVTRLLMKVMLDTAGPEVLVVTKVKFISLQKDGFVVLTPNQELEASSELLPINYGGLSKARQFLSKLGDLNQTQIFAKIESVEVFLFQKTALYRCNMAGKPDVLTRVVDSMTNNLRPTRAVATDVANAVLDGSDAILLGAETLRGLHPVETVSTVSRICAEVEGVKLGLAARLEREQGSARLGLAQGSCACVSACDSQEARLGLQCRRRGAACTRRGLGTCGHGRGFGFGFGRAGVERFRVRVRRLEAARRWLLDFSRCDGWLTDVPAALRRI
ncbi:pyruvate kinase 1, cytosolic-like isoform X11 [Cucumis melo]|uniref:pyruvate kinase n=1 Tax=Cucumis melo TaxID=3656 RepID=A0ABM3LCE0_CUCME|nr:pyruvate kinase 1, cytosolic-like isoform X11 [Cucumis melo]